LAARSAARGRLEIWRRRVLATAGVLLGSAGAWWLLDVPAVWVDSFGVPVQSVELVAPEPALDLGGVAGLPRAAEQAAIGDDPAGYAPVAAPPPKPRWASLVEVQVSASSRLDWAEELASDLSRQGFASWVRDDGPEQKATRFKVRVRGRRGESSDALLRRLRQEGHTAWEVPR